jgi:hypothetical protein
MFNESEYLLVVKLNIFENTKETNFLQNSTSLSFWISKIKEEHIMILRKTIESATVKD